MRLAALFAVTTDLHIIMEIRELMMVALSQSLSSSPAWADRHSERQQLIHRVLISSSYCLLTTKQGLSSWHCSCKDPRGSALQLHHAALHFSQQSLPEHFLFFFLSQVSFQILLQIYNGRYMWMHQSTSPLLIIFYYYFRSAPFLCLTLPIMAIISALHDISFVLIFVQVSLSFWPTSFMHENGSRRNSFFVFI